MVMCNYTIPSRINGSKVFVMGMNKFQPDILKKAKCRITITLVTKEKHVVTQIKKDKVWYT